MKYLLSIILSLGFYGASLAQSAPDLKLDSLLLLTEGTVYPNQLISARLYYEWNGASSTQIDYYLSEDSLFSTSDQFVATGLVNPGQNEFINVNFNLPTTNNGNKYLIAVGNRALTFFESNFGNNTVFTSLIIEPLPKFDLVAQNLTIANATLTAGTNTIVNYTVVRRDSLIGNQQINIQFFLSKDKNLDTDDHLAGQSSFFTGLLATDTLLTQAANIFVPEATDLDINYVIMMVDADHRLIEYDESNNTFPLEIVVNPILHPDLLIDDMILPDEVTPGVTFNFNTKISNQGQAVANNPTITYFLSTDEVFDGKDLNLLNLNTLTSFNVDTLVSIDPNLTLPNYITPGDYFLIAVVDYAQSIRETNENNNTLSRPLKVLPIPLPDFKFTELNTPSSIIDAGFNMAVNFSIFNQGNQEGNFQSVNFYFSNDIELNASDTLIARFTNGQNVSPDTLFGQTNGTFTIPIPRNMLEGEYQLIAVVNPEQITLESDYTNNDSLTTVIIRNADATLDAGELNKTYIVGGDAVQLSYQYKNLADIAVLPGLSIGYYLSKDSTFVDGQDPFIRSQFEAPLGATETRSLNTTLTVPDTLTQGKWYWVIKADFNNQVRETNENNNLLFVPFTIQTPDLRFASLEANPSTADASGNTVIEYRINNAGKARAPGTQVHFYLSSDNNLNPEEDYFLGSSNIAALDSGATSANTLSLNVSLPMIAAGSYRVVGLIDPFENLVESNKQNNLANTQLNIRNADLVFLNAALTQTTVEIAKNDTLNFSIRNQGAARALNISYQVVIRNASNSYRQIISSNTISSLDGDGTVAGPFSLPFAVPANFPSANAIIQLIVDSDSTIIETNENNNVVNLDLNLLLPDFTLTNPVVSPNTVDIGFATTISLRANNVGQADAVASEVNFFLSEDTTLDDNDEALNISISLEPIEKTRNLDKNVSLTIPSNVQSLGSFNLIYYIDGNQQVTESNENNNIVTQPITLRAGDLTIPSASSNRPIVRLTEQFTATVRVRNESQSARVPASQMYVYLSEQPIFNNEAVFAFAVSVPTIALSTSSDISVDILLADYVPSNLRPGKYYVIFKADGPENITETNENNNIRTLEITIEGPDLRPAALLTNKTIYDQNEAGTIDFDILNEGPVAAATSSYALYFSETEQLTDQSTYLFQGFANSIQANNKLEFRGMPFTIPSATPAGDYFMLVVADVDNVIGEISETNNVAATPISVRAPDLIVENIRLSDSTVDPDQLLTITFDINNIGEGRARAGQAAIYVGVEGDSLPTLIRTVSVPALQPSTKANDLTTNWSVALSAVDTGFNYLYIRADFTNTSLETDETNNLDSIQFYVNPSDVAMDTALVSPAWVDSRYFNNNVSIPVNVLATYTRFASSNITPRVYFSRNSTLDDSDTLLSITNLQENFLNDDLEFLSGTIWLPADIEEGNYFLIFKADPDNILKEKDENNNLLAVPLRVGEPILPDLLIDGLQALPDSIASGREFVAFATIRNNGPVVAQASRLSYYLSSTESLTSAAIPLDIAALISNLSPAAVSRNSRMLTIPENTVAGQYFILAKVDSNDSIPELLENNNILSKSIQVRNPLPVDMALTYMSYMPVLGIPVDNYQVRGEIQNLGTGAAFRPQTYAFYLSTDQTIGSSDILLSSDTIDFLSPYATLNINKTLVLPSVAPGQYFIIARVDNGNIYNEANEENNIHIEAISIEAAQAPDLIWVNLTLFSNLNPNNNFSASSSIRNQGGALAETPFNISLYLSDKPVLNADKILLGRSGVNAALAPFGTINNTGLYFVPPTVKEGSYYLISIIDEEEVLNESSYDNNTRIRQINVGNPLVPDLAINLINNVVTYTNELGTERVFYQVGNFGNRLAEASIRFFLSNDAQLSSNDILIGADTLAFFVSNFATNYNLELNIPTNTAVGEYFIIGIIDQEGAVFENNKENNVYVAELIVNPPSQPDLTFNYIEFSSSAINANAIIDVYYQLANIDRRLAENVLVEFYLSTTASVNSGSILLGSETYESLQGFSSLFDTKALLIPASVATGTYFIAVSIDPNNNISESDETNNQEFWQVQILPAALPELSIAINSANAQVNANTNLSVNYSILNNAAGAAIDVDVRFYLSTDANLSANDIVVGNATISEIRGNSIESRSIQIFIPASVSPGNYQLIALVDEENNIEEGNENNNVTTRAITVNAPILADISIISLFAETTARAGDATNVEFTVYNGSQGFASAFVVDVVLRNSGGQEFNLAQVQVPGLGAFESSFEQQNVIIPLNLASGNYVWVIKADAANAVPESNENNNIRERVVFVDAALPAELVLGNLQLNRSAMRVGESNTVSFTINNTEANPSAATNAFVYLSTTQDPSGAQLLGEVTIESLSAGANTSKSFEFAIAEDFTEIGNYFIVIVLDPNNQVPELNKDNNRAAVALSISQALGLKTVLNQVLVYPNPSRDWIIIDQIPGAYQVKVISLDGKLMINQSALGTASISVSNLKAGVYILVLTTEQGESKQLRIVKE